LIGAEVTAGEEPVVIGAIGAALVVPATIAELIDEASATGQTV